LNFTNTSPCFPVPHFPGVAVRRGTGKFTDGVLGKGSKMTKTKHPQFLLDIDGVEPKADNDLVLTFIQKLSRAIKALPQKRK
jgi:hypothetical protein